MSDFDKQNLFLYESVYSYPVKRRRPRSYPGTLRTNVYKFHLSTPCENILVCKKFFINTFNISAGRIDRILKAKDIPKDMRGRMDGSCRRTSELAIKFVREHIKSFPSFESHYTRSQNRNIQMALMWLRVVQSSENNIEIIDHKFLLSGHSYLPNDADFGVIEMALRKKNFLYTPEDNYEIIKQCQRDNKFNLYKMKRENFIST